MPKVIDNVKEDILEKALKMLYDGDIDDVNIRRIAKECNIGMGTVYNYFPSKQELMKDVLKLHIDTVFDNIKNQTGKCNTKEEKAKQIYLILKNLFLKSDKQIIKNIASVALLYPLDETEMLASEVKRFGKQLEGLVKDELNISDDIAVHIVVNTIVFFAHNSEYTFEQAWERLEKLL